MRISGLLLFKDEAQWFLKESVQSFLSICDEIIAVDTGSSDDSVDVLESINDGRIKILYKRQKKDRNKEYGDIRNWALQFCSGDYVFNFDADEVLDDEGYLIKEQLESNPEIDCWSIRGRHYYWHLNKEDAQLSEHWWQLRLFKNNGLIKYPSGKSHGLPFGFVKEGKLKGCFIHHYGYCKNVIIDLWRYEMNYGDFEMHSESFLNEWLMLRLTGRFPVKEVGLDCHPEVIKKKFYFERWCDDYRTA